MTRGVLVLVLLVGSCGPQSPPAASDAAPSARRATETPIEGPVVATVDGEPIGIAEVEATARATGLSPLDALHRLEQERVLVARVDTQARDPEAESAARRAAVQALLRERVEQAVGESSVGDDEIAARYAAQRTAWVRAERRASVHVLASPHDASDEAARAAAERFVRSVITRLSAASDPVAEAEAIGHEDTSGRTYDVRVEVLPPTERHGPLVEPYLAALFALSSPPAVTPEPVPTSFGLHAIVLTSIEPAFVVSLDEATPVLRRQLLAEHRAAALDALCAEIAARTPIAVDERLAATVFAADLGAGP